MSKFSGDRREERTGGLAMLGEVVRAPQNSDLFLALSNVSRQKESTNGEICVLSV